MLRSGRMMVILFSMLVLQACAKHTYPGDLSHNLNDFEISEKVRSLLASHEVTETNSITVSTYKGWVTLAGHAQEDQQVDFAKSLATEVVDSMHVINRVKVYPTTETINKTSIVPIGY
ncbi:MAG TPA: BON domain-containing protein [Coxiellaceae bacterium]|nr:BON domain-containing protein [Coxiellaceae bacterium]